MNSETEETSEIDERRCLYDVCWEIWLKSVSHYYSNENNFHKICITHDWTNVCKIG